MTRYDERRRHTAGEFPAGGTGLARVLSKLGVCSRREAGELIRAGRVRVNGVVRRDPEWRTRPGADRIEVDGQVPEAAAKVHLMLNKPRGLVTTAADEHGRATVFSCLESADLPRVFPVGRLDRASEGLLLMTNDSAWAARITDPASRIEKVYHVQIDCVAGDELLARMVRGAEVDGEHLAAKRVRLLRLGAKNSWLEVVLDEGRNRHLRRLLAALGVEVMRLVRVAIGPLQLGPLAKGAWRRLTESEVRVLAGR
jgi:23S rRNA pseudouridine2605 synthase